jgi:CheY-like chemotaxis protein
MARCVSVAEATWSSLQWGLAKAAALLRSPRILQSPLQNQHLGIIDAPHYGVHRSLVGDTARILVCVVDDDDSVRESLPDLLWEFGFASEIFAAPADFLQSGVVSRTSCLILDIVMPGMSGPELRRELLRQGRDIPTIFITAHAVFASQPDLQEGAVDCLLKPFSETVLLEALKRALKLK